MRGVEIKSSLDGIEKSIINPTKTTSVAVQENQVVGIVAWQPEDESFESSSLSSSHSAHLSNLFIDPSVFGTVQGLALLCEALQQMQKADFRTVRLWCPFRADSAHKLYQDNGFSLTGNQTEYEGITRLERRLYFK